MHHRAVKGLITPSDWLGELGPGQQIGVQFAQVRQLRVLRALTSVLHYLSEGLLVDLLKVAWGADGVIFEVGYIPNIS